MNVIKLYDSRNYIMEDKLWFAYKNDLPFKHGGFRSYIQENAGEGIISMNSDGDIRFESEEYMMLFLLRWS